MRSPARRALSRFTRMLRWKAPPGVALPALDPAMGPVYAVGDVHGCLALLRALEERIRRDAAALAGRPRIVLLGDMIDRGPETAALIDHCLKPLPWGERLAILGNHEAMMLGFLAAPHRNIDWLLHGGFETLRSYGLTLDPGEMPRLSPRRVEQMLAAHLPERHLAWLRGLPHGFQLRDDGGTGWILAHAGFDPARPPEDQPAETLLWGPVLRGPVLRGPGAPEAAAMPASSSAWRLVHGHVIRERVDLEARTIGIDTGAWKTGRLSALRLAPGPAPALISLLPPETATIDDEGPYLGQSRN